MKWIAMVLVLALAACGKQTDRKAAQAPTAAAMPNLPAKQSAMPGKAMPEMQLIPIPKDKAQLARLIAMGYTVHNDHMHPPGVKSCPFDKQGGSVIE